MNLETPIYSDIWNIVDYRKFFIDYPEFKDKVKAGPNAITAIYTNNVTSKNNFVPLTAWILAHRLIHPIQSNSEVYLGFDKMERKLHKILSGIGTQVYKSNIREVTVFLIDPPLFAPIAKAIFTMKSARTDKLYNSTDLTSELFAQYIITGKVKINPLPDQLEVQKGVFNDADPVQKEIYDQKLNELVAEMPGAFNDLLESLKGKIIIW
jgi:hypothetical protein